MSLDLSQAFESEIASATNQIEMAKQALATEEDREQAELLRFRIRNLGKWLEALKANHTAVILAEDKVPEMEERYLRWRELCVAARGAQDQMEALARKVQPARDACIPFENAVRRAEVAVQMHRATALPDYPTQPEIARRAAKEKKLQLALDEARAELREVNGTASQIFNAWIAARQKYDDACFAERMARPPNDEPAGKSWRVA